LIAVAEHALVKLLSVLVLGFFNICLSRQSSNSARSACVNSFRRLSPKWSSK
jgi:hypothetical protein